MPNSTTKSLAMEKVGECLYRYTPTGTYYARIQVRGKETRRSLKTTDRAMAKRRLSDMQQELLRFDRTAGQCSLAELAERYLASVQDRAPATIRYKRDIVTRMKASFPGGAGVSIHKILPSAYGAWLASLDVGASGYNQYLSLLRGMFALAETDSLISTSPIEHLKCRRVDVLVRKTPSIEEFKAIVANVYGQRARNPHHPSDFKRHVTAEMVEFMGLSGLGIAEASALTWGDINWRDGQITTFRHKTRRGFVIPIYPQLLPFLERVRNEEGGNPPHDLRLFPGTGQRAHKAIISACARLELPAYTSRSLRRMFITKAIQKGVDVKVVSQWQGHADGGRLILSTYSHVTPVHSTRMAALMTQDG